MSHKSGDFFISFGCFSCHQVVDGQVPSDFTYEERRLMLLEGMVRTQNILFREGILRVA
jgi:hypothetical protein